MHAIRLLLKLEHEVEGEVQRLVVVSPSSIVTEIQVSKSLNSYETVPEDEDDEVDDIGDEIVKIGIAVAVHARTRAMKATKGPKSGGVYI